MSIYKGSLDGSLSRRSLLKASVGGALVYGAWPLLSARAQDGSLVVALSYAPKVINPNYDFDGANYFIAPNVFSRLVDYGSDGVIYGDLAEAWETSDDRMTYTFKLRQGVTWSDGKPFSADDVVWTVTSLQDDKAYGARAIAGLTKVEKVDDFTVTLTIGSPNSSFLDQLSNRYGFVVLPKHIYEGTNPRDNPANQRPVGTGPFIVDEYVPGSYVSLRANPNYFRGKPKIEGLIFRVFPDITAAVTALRAGDVGFLASSPPFSALGQIEGVSGVAVDFVSPVPSIMHSLAFNLRRKPLDDVRVRTAIAHAINRNQLNDLIFGGRLKVADAAYISSSWAWDDTALQPGFDVAKANELLDASGNPRGADGTRFSINFIAFRAAVWGSREIGEVMKQQLAEVGINLTVEFYDFAVYAQRILKDHDYDMVWQAGPHGPDPQLFAAFVKSMGPTNSMGYNNPDIDALFDKARAASSREEAMPSYVEIQKTVARDLPRLSLLEWKYAYPRSAKYKGFWWQGEGELPVPNDCYRNVELT